MSLDMFDFYMSIAKGCSRSAAGARAGLAKMPDRGGFAPHCRAVLRGIITQDESRAIFYAAQAAFELAFPWQARLAPSHLAHVRDDDRQWWGRRAPEFVKARMRERVSARFTQPKRLPLP